MILPTQDGDFVIQPDVKHGLYVKYKCDVDAELALMSLWLAKNPKSRPKRPLRFVENWLKKRNGVDASSSWGKDGSRSPVRHRKNVPEPAGTDGLSHIFASPHPSTAAASPAPLTGTRGATPTLLAAATTTRTNGMRPLSAVFADMRLIVGGKK